MNLKRLIFASTSLIIATSMASPAMNWVWDPNVEIYTLDGPKIEETESETEAEPETEAAVEEKKPESVYSGITMTAEEGALLKRVLAAEAQQECFEGQKAVVEVVFNRVLSPNWPNTVYGVLTQKGQFAGYRLRNASYVKPSEVQDDAISEVLAETSTVLPSKKYVYFDTTAHNGSKHVKIQHHYFGMGK